MVFNSSMLGSTNEETAAGFAKKELYLLRTLDKYEKNNFRNCLVSRIDIIESLRKIHSDFNNRQYLKVDFDSEGERKEICLATIIKYSPRFGKKCNLMKAFRRITKDGWRKTYGTIIIKMI